MSTLFYHRTGETTRKEVNDEHPLPVWVPDEYRPPALNGAAYTADYLWRLGMNGRVYVAADADQNDAVTGQTSFAATTPTFLLRVPQGTIALPLFLNLSQTGSVAGGAIDVLIEIDHLVDRYASGGTSEKVVGMRRGVWPPACALYTGATASAGYGITVWRATIGQDVSPAEGAVQGPFWRPELPYFIEGPASLLIFTYAGTTGPTWFWQVGWAEVDVATGE